MPGDILGDEQNQLLDESALDAFVSSVERLAPSSIEIDQGDQPPLPTEPQTAQRTQSKKHRVAVYSGSMCCFRNVINLSPETTFASLLSIVCKIFGVSPRSYALVSNHASDTKSWKPFQYDDAALVVDELSALMNDSSKGYGRNTRSSQKVQAGIVDLPSMYMVERGGNDADAAEISDGDVPRAVFEKLLLLGGPREDLDELPLESFVRAVGSSKIWYDTFGSSTRKVDVGTFVEKWPTLGPLLKDRNFHDDAAPAPSSSSPQRMCLACCPTRFGR